MAQVLIQIVADDQGEVSLEYLAELVRLLPPGEIVRLLTRFAAELDQDAEELQAGLKGGKLPPWISQTPPAPAEIGIIERVEELPPPPPSERRPAWGRVRKFSAWWWFRSWWRRERLE